MKIDQAAFDKVANLLFGCCLIFLAMGIFWVGGKFVAWDTISTAIYWFVIGTIVQQWFDRTS